MTAYEVETADLVTMAGQLQRQADQSQQTVAGVKGATTVMLTDVRTGAAGAVTTVTDLLGQLADVVSAAVGTATAADWTGADSDRFRTENSDLAGLISRSQQQLDLAFDDHLAATDQVAEVLSAMVSEFAAAASRSGQLSAELSAAVRAEADQYEAAFAGGLGALVVGAGAVGAFAGATAQGLAGTARSNPMTDLGRPFSLTPDETRAVARDGVEGVLQLGDNVPRLGKDRLNSPFEDQLLRHWLDGSGQTYELSPGELGTVTGSPIAQRVGAAIADHEAPTRFDQKPVALREVTLANGERGYAAAVDFYDPLPNGQPNSLDGSIGGATVYYNSRGEAVGVRDRYDFTNDNVQVDLTNFAGSLVGAKDYDVRGGVTER